MTDLKVDPWDPEYGGSVEIEPEPVDREDIELDVEGVPWATIRPEPPSALPRCAFIDGVRRVDVRLFAEEEGQEAPAVAGSWGVGVAWSTRPPEIDTIRIGRELVVGGGLDHEDLALTVGPASLRYRYSGVAETGFTAPIQGLQNRMRAAEAALAEDVFEAGRADLMVLDGPLTYFAKKGPVVGLIKRQSQRYLPPERTILFHDLAPGERTPLFKFGEQRLERYAWYTRIARGRTIDGLMTGVVRLEVSAQVGTRRAAELADLASALLPRFASTSGRDPRAPQNLYPVAHLETILRHRLGDAELLRRALESHLWRQAHDRP